jgi:hypothetical protein
MLCTTLGDKFLSGISRALQRTTSQCPGLMMEAEIAGRPWSDNARRRPVSAVLFPSEPLPRPWISSLRLKSRGWRAISQWSTTMFSHPLLLTLDVSN